MNESGGSNADFSAPIFNSAQTTNAPTVVAAANLKLTGTFGNIDMTNGQAGRLMIGQLCREGSNAGDTTTDAPVRLYEIYISWPLTVDVQ